MSEIAQPQPVTPELRQWIIEQAKAGVQPESVLQSMVASGWREDVAIAALEDTLRGFLDERAKVAQLPAAVRVPDPLPAVAGIPTTLQAGDREVRVVLAMRDPRVIVFGGLLSHEECDELMAVAGKRLARSETVQTDTGASEVNDARTSQGMFFDRGENELCRRIEARIAALLKWPVENGEGLQVLHYRPGAEYKPHYDYFDPAQSGTPTILKRGGQRVATVVMYLNDPVIGGGTTFPDVQLEVAPVKGNAVFFSYERAHPVSRTLHGGAPVVEGEKWVATKWLREGVFR
ncbi:2OG-Fe(II) oxygenase [Rhizobacter sp. AJA081-3]|uniref:2OG-Fe(II) oxygenase n=1 Tax=Rhizobacter sp. AJA081-3 TaxID=2753607 RepID=UPI001ADF1BCE|nr:2OG-Fe(II) oxygenase [Rhizobacter sp. AJA081-3]QTN21417.1 2OG-Fe(II) oxygenase [Rhizobacter sp. AJA081-3]